MAGRALVGQRVGKILRIRDAGVESDRGRVGHRDRAGESAGAGSVDRAVGGPIDRVERARRGVVAVASNHPDQQDQS